MISNSNNIDEVLEILISYAQGNYTERVFNVFSDPELERLRIGVNMLGEELLDRTISKSYFYELFDAISDMVFLTDGDLNILEYNLSAKEWFKLSFKKKAKTKVWELFQKFESDLDQMTCESIIRSGQKSEVVFRLDQTEIITKLTISRVLSENLDLKGYLFVIQDISKEKQAQRELMNAIITTEENERRRISHDLHDSLGQELNALKMHIEMLIIINEQDDDFSSVLNASKEIVAGSIINLKSIARNLLPPALNVGDLSFAIIDMINKVTSSIEFELDLPDVVNMITKEVQTSIYRVIQEFVNNSIKYSKCSTIRISIKQMANKLKVAISDNGIGFAMNDLHVGNGISNIKSRLNILNASYNYESIEARGSFLNFEIDI